MTPTIDTIIAETRARQKRNADLIELLQASHDEMAAYTKRLRACDPHSAPVVGGWTLAVASAIAILKEDAEGWIAAAPLAAAQGEK